MDLSPHGMDTLKRLEGCRLTAYPDTAGVWTIGYGHTGHEVVPGLSWSQAHADEQLAQDVARFARGVDGACVALPQSKFDALVILAFNIGLAAFDASTALMLANAGQWGNVPAAMRRWNKIHDPHTGDLVVSAGLVKRREAEVALWEAP